MSQTLVGGYTITSCILQNVDKSLKIDISNLFGEIIITEELFKSYVYGNITVVDKVNALGQFPILGEETLIISYFCSLRPSLIRTYTFYVYRCSEHSMSSQNGATMYTLYFISYDQYTAAINPVSRNYQGSASSIITNILQAKINTKLPLNIQQTNDNLNFTLPRQTYFDTITFLRNHAQSILPNDTNYWLFYLNNTGYNFTTLSNLIKTSLARQTSLNSQNPTIDTNLYWADFRNISALQSPEINAHNITNGAFAKLFDTFVGIREGYYSTVNAFYDIAQRKYSVVNQNYLDLFNKIQHMDSNAGQRQSNTFYQNIANTTPGYSLRYTSALASDSAYYDQNISTASLHYKIFEETPLIASVYGDTIIQTGDILNLNLIVMSADTQYNPTPPQDPFKSGNYMVGRVNHVFQANKYYMQLTLFKDGNAQTSAINPNTTFSVAGP